MKSHNPEQCKLVITPDDGGDVIEHTFGRYIYAINYIREIVFAKPLKYSKDGHTATVKGFFKIEADFDLKAHKGLPSLAQHMGPGHVHVKASDMTDKARKERIERFNKEADRLSGKARDWTMPQYQAAPTSENTDEPQSKPAAKKKAPAITGASIKLKDLCKEYNKDAAKARRLLRSAAKKNPDIKANGWEWAANSEILDEVRKIIQGI